jgi:AAA domain
VYVIRDLVAEILNSKATFIDSENKERGIALRDILIIAPYNAQIFELQERLPGASVGTVDKFQGQEAPIVIYSTDEQWAISPSQPCSRARAKMVASVIASPGTASASAKDAFIRSQQELEKRDVSLWDVDAKALM